LSIFAEVLEGEQSEDQDVLAEEARVLANLGTEMDPQSAIEVRGLRMSFRRNGKPFHAVKSPFFAMRKRTLFALLGPNGAGKTTTINMLTGLLNPSAGEALIATSNGTKSITCATDMGDIRNAMGICPQFDILWGVCVSPAVALAFCLVGALLPPRSLCVRIIICARSTLSVCTYSLNSSGIRKFLQLSRVCRQQM
jgi:energy-coupling factor transporter ATP-binding protein EcfA2